MNKIIISIVFMAFSFAVQSKGINHIRTVTDGSIEGAIDVLISQDDKFVYVAGFEDIDKDLLTFERDTELNTLKVIQQAPENFSLNRVYEMILSQDQKYIYAVAEGSDEISVLSRDFNTGILTEIQHISSIDIPEAQIADTTVIVESSNGDYIFVAGDDIKVTVFRRSETGELEFVDLWEVDPSFALGYKITDLISVPDSNLIYFTSVNGIGALELNESTGELSYLWSDNSYESASKQNYQLAFNPASNDIYVASRAEISVFQRNLSSGALTLLQSIDVPEVAETMILPRAINVQGDSLYLIVAEDGNFGSFEHNGIIQYNIHSASGLLNEVSSIHNDTDIELMHGPMEIAFASDGTTAFVPVFVNGLLLQFGVDSSSGNLSYQTYTNASDGVRGISAPQDIDVSEDQQFLYVTDISSGVSVFKFDEQSESLNFLQSVSSYDFQYYRHENGTLSPDGKYFYLIESQQEKITVLQRDAETGILNVSRSYENGAEWIEQFDSPSSLEISANGEFAYAAHSTSFSLVTIMSRNTETGELAYINRVENNLYGNTNGIGTFSGLVLSHIMPDNRHLIVFSNSGQLALFAIDQITGELALKQLMEGELFGETNLHVSTEFIGINGEFIYLPYQTRGEFSSIVDEGILVVKLNSETGLLELKHNYIGNDSDMGWLLDRLDFKLNKNGDRAYLTKKYGDSFVTVDVNKETGELTFLDENTNLEVDLPAIGQPILASVFANDTYLVGVDSFNGTIELFRKNTAPGFLGNTNRYSVNINNLFTLDLGALFSDIDSDEFSIEIVGEMPEWLTENENVLEGTPGDLDVSATISVVVNDGIDETLIDLFIDVVVPQPTPSPEIPAGSSGSSGGGSIFFMLFGILGLFVLRTNFASSPQLTKRNRRAFEKAVG